MKLFKNVFLAFVALVFSASVTNAGEKWDMALAYGAGNFHSANDTSTQISRFYSEFDLRK